MRTFGHFLLVAVIVYSTGCSTVRGTYGSEDEVEKKRRMFSAHLADLIKVPLDRVDDLGFIKDYFETKIGLGTPRPQALDRIRTLFSKTDSFLEINFGFEENVVTVVSRAPTFSLKAVFVFKFDAEGKYSTVLYGRATDFSQRINENQH